MAITATGLDNRGQIATGRDLAATVSGNLYNRENKLLFAGRDMTLNVGSVLDNNRAELYSQRDMTLQGLNGNNSASIRNFVGTIEAGGNLKNETASETTVNLNRKWGKEWDQKRTRKKWCGSIFSLFRCDETYYTREREEKWDTYTTTVYAKEQAIFNAHGTVNVNGRSIRNGSVKNLDNPSHTTTYNTASIEQIKKTGQVDLTEFLTLPQGEHGLFRLNPAPRELVASASLSLVLPGELARPISPTKPRRAHRYLIESNVEFIDTTRFVGSEYFLDRMGVDLNENLRLMGDAVVETRLVERAILEVTNHAFLSGDVGSSAEQMTRLYDAALAEAGRFEQEGMPLTVGVALSPEQVKSLRHDMIWLEEREIAGQRVLAPQLYLSQMTLAQIESGTGPVISGGDVLLASQEDFGNQGTITARRDVGISSEGSFTNTGSVEAGESLVVDVKEDIVNRGPGSLYGGDLVALYAEGDIRNESTAEEIHLGEDIVSRFADTASIGSGGDMILDAGGDIVQKAAKLRAEGSAVLDAGGDISFETIALRNKSVVGGSSRSSGLFGSSSSSYSATYDRTEHVGNEAVFGGDLVMKSGGDTTLTATRTEVGGGADITTGGSFDLLSAQNTYHSESHYEYDGGGWFGSSGSEDSVSDETRQVSSVLKVGKNLSLGSGRDINISASRVEVEGDAGVTAAGNFNLLSKTNTLSESSSKTHDGMFSESEEKHTKDTVNHVSSAFNVGGKLDVEAKQVNLIASTIKARQAEIEADLIQLVSEKNLDSETHFSDGSGVLLRKIKNKGHVKEEVVEAGIQVAEKLVVNGRTLVEEGLGKDNLLKNLGSQSDLDIAGVKLIKQVANNKEWDDEITSLSATGQLLVQAVVAYFTAGVGAGAVNAGNAAVQAGIDAAINSLIQQATTKMVESALTGNPLKFDTKAMLMGAITSAASGVASHGMNSALGEGLVADVQKTALKSTGRAVVETAVYGGDFRDRLGDNLKTGMVDLAGSKLTEKVGDMGESLGGDGSLGKILLHAGVGCGTAAGKGGSCASGALGSAVAEQLSGTLGSNGLAEKEDKLILDLATIGAATVTGLDGEAALDSAVMTDTYNRRLHQDEAKVLEKELEKLEKQGLAEQERDKNKADLMASACALVNCADGVSKDDPKYAQLRALQDYGERLKGSDAYEQVAKYQAEGLFEYGKLKDGFNDFLTRNDKIITRVTGGVDIVSGSIAVKAGVVLCTTGVPCVVGAPLVGLGASQVILGGKKAFGDYRYTEGQEVINSFFSGTHTGYHNPALDLGLNYGLAVSGKIISKTSKLIKPKGLGGNPFKGKSPQQLDDLFKKKGFVTKGKNPVSGQGKYINPKTGYKYYIDKGKKYKKGVELPHVDVEYPKGSSLPKKKFPLGDKLVE
uniref:Haemagluttinin repeat-containing protein n=1 Tax=Candidatus Kentrum sp. UNK TaxID=2126344 RepID=A0A451AKM2_9GAMM|nr:MAG: Haemagluttinin repeat-containing protein [Candidatus Kentron sp. UNK]VFK69922.1 MAG: Haemagluttinin repeat-containing protein [Candidatus Kentron sp. UNK]